MKVDITEEEVKEIGKVVVQAANPSDPQDIDWRIVSIFLSKIDRIYYVQKGD